MAFDPGLLDTSSNALIRSGAGVLSLLLGLFILSLRPRPRFSKLLGGLLLLNVVNYALYALGGAYSEFQNGTALLVPTLASTSIGSLVSAVVAFLLAGLLFREAGTSSPRQAALYAVGAAAFLGIIVPFNLTYPFDRLLAQNGSTAGAFWNVADGNLYTLYCVALWVLLLACMEGALRCSGRPGAALLVAGAGLLLDPANTMGYTFSEVADPTKGFALTLAITVVLANALLLTGILSLLRFGGRRHGPLATGLLLLLLLATLAELVAVVLFHGRDGHVGGVTQVLGVGLVAYAVFRLDLLGVPLPRVRLRASTLATIALAALFITAQVAQNFFSDRFGLLLGGVVAGAAVFAAYPLQRRAERALERRPGIEDDAPAAKYRRLVETAWRDGRLGANERLLLAEARRQLGLDAEAAGSIDEDVAGRHVRGGA